MPPCCGLLTELGDDLSCCERIAMSESECLNRGRLYAPLMVVGWAMLHLTASNHLQFVNSASPNEAAVQHIEQVYLAGPLG